MSFRDILSENYRNLIGDAKSFIKDTGMDIAKRSAYAWLPQYPEDASREDLNQYYSNLFDIANKGGALLDIIGNPDQMAQYLGGDPSLLTQYFSGEDTPVPLFNNQEDIDWYLQELHNIYGNSPIASNAWSERRSYGTSDKDMWYASENPDYPAEDGWQFLQYSPKDVFKILGLSKQEGYGEDIHNLLGMTSTMRRKYNPENDSWEYQIVEDWDALKGDNTYKQMLKEYEAAKSGYDDWDDDYFKGAENRLSYLNALERDAIYPGHREVPEYLAELVMQYAPDFFTIGHRMLDSDIDEEELAEANMKLLRFAPNIDALYYLDSIDAGFPITGQSIISESEWDDIMYSSDIDSETELIRTKGY